jgi:hypothetical protein
MSMDACRECDHDKEPSPWGILHSMSLCQVVGVVFECQLTCRRLSEEESAASRHALEAVEPHSPLLQAIMEAFVQQPQQPPDSSETPSAQEDLAPASAPLCNLGESSQHAGTYCHFQDSLLTAFPEAL